MSSPRSSPSTTVGFSSRLVLPSGEILGGEQLRPYALQAEITNHCDLSCGMCPSPRLRPGEHMSREVWRNVLGAAKQAEKGLIMAGFGEPLAHPSLFEFLDDLEASNVPVSLSTNGTGVTREVVGRLNQYPNIAHINVSVDSPDARRYRAIRGNDLGPVRRGLEELARGLNRLDRLTVSSVVMRSNIRSLALMPGYLAQLGVATYALQSLHEWHPGLRKEQLVHDGTAASDLNRIEQECQRLGIALQIPPRMGAEADQPDQATNMYHSDRPGNLGPTKQCGVPWDVPFVTAAGALLPCCHFDRDWPGSGPVEGDLSQAWSTSHWQDLRDSLTFGPPPESCARCRETAWGAHLTAEYRAELVEVVGAAGQRTIKVVAKNTGTREWTKETKVRVGTANPRDRQSGLITGGWLSAARPATFGELVVSPGATATFEFDVDRAGLVGSESFQLLVEYALWLPDTQFEVRADAGEYSALPGSLEAAGQPAPA